MTPASTARHDTPLARWERPGLGIRCACNPGQPALIRHWLPRRSTMILPAPAACTEAGDAR